MKKKTLSFNSLSKLVSFSRQIAKGYLINTVNLTITSDFSMHEIEKALDHHDAHLMLTTENVFSYTHQIPDEVI